jgi:hypothetical protein
MGLGPPYLQELIFGHQLPGMLHQVVQRDKSLVRQMDRLLHPPQPLVPYVHTKGFEDEDALFPHVSPPVPLIDDLLTGRAEHVLAMCSGRFGCERLVRS